MINGQALLTLRRNLSFFAARGVANTLSYSRWRVKRWLQYQSARSTSVDTEELLASLDPQVVMTGAAHASTPARLAAYFRGRTNPVLFFDEADAADIVAQIPIEQQAQTIRAADQVCQNSFDFRGAPVHFDGSVDWAYCPNGNIDWRWDLNRHTFIETLGRAYRYTGDERYALKFRELLCDWLARNPARIDQVNWTSVFEVAFRIDEWVWALAYFRPSHVLEEMLEQFLAGLLTHAHYLNANLELHVPNNHLLLEAKALALLGILFPEFKEADTWRTRGLRLLETQVRAQVCADGVHGERTTLYHRVIAGELLELLVAMENNRLPIPPGLREPFTQMVEFELALCKPDGSFPLLGDSAQADTHLRFSASSGGALFLGTEGLPLQESDYWLLGSRVPSRRHSEAESRPHGTLLPFVPNYEQSRAFPVGGYYLMRAGQDADARYLIFDCGPFGLSVMPNHGHADALSFELYANGQTLLVDPGFYGTALGLDWRNFFRGTRAHNTIAVDGLDQSQLLDERRVYRPANATCLDWASNRDYDFVDGMHDGYTRLDEPVTHRRQIFFAKPCYWVIVDVLTGRGQHHFDLYFHLLPGSRALLDSDPAMVRVETLGAGLVIGTLAGAPSQREIVTGSNQPIQGWVSFRSGEKLPAPTLRLRQTAPTPLQLCTVLYPYRVGETPNVTISPLKVNGRAADDPMLTAVRIETPLHVDELVIDRAGGGRTHVDFKTQIKDETGCE